MMGFAVDWLDPISLLLLAAACLLLVRWSLVYLERRRSARLGRFAAAAVLARLVTGPSSASRRPLNGSVLAGLALLLLALAGPQWGGDSAFDRRSRREILVVLDTSESMNAPNPAPSRLDRAQRKVTELLLRHPADRFGLVAFSGGAALQCPLTTDHSYFKTVLHAVDTDTISEEGTDIQSALDEAAALLVGQDRRENSVGREGRIVVLMSDGEAIDGDAVAAASQLAAFSHVMVLGIGDPEGAAVTLPQWMQRKMRPGDLPSHVSRLDEDRLSQIAIAGKGVYVRSTLGDADVNVIDREIAYLESLAVDDSPGSARTDRYRWPLALAGLFFAFEGIWLVLLPRFVAKGASALGGTRHESE